MQDTKTYSNSFTDYFKLLPPGFLEALESNQQGGTPAKDSKGGIDLTSPFFGHASPGTPGATSPASASSSLRVSFVPAGSPPVLRGTPGPGGALPSAFALPQEPVTPPKPLPALRPILPVASDDALDMIESAREPRREALIQTEVDASLRRYAGTSGVEARADALRHGLRCLQKSAGCSLTRSAAGSFTPRGDIERARQACTLARALLPAVAACAADPAWSGSASPQRREQLLSAWFTVAHMALVALHDVRDASLRARAGAEFAALLQAGETSFGAPGPLEAEAGQGYNYNRHKQWLLAASHGKWISQEDVYLVFDSLPPTARFRHAYLEALGLSLAHVLEPAPAPVPWVNLYDPIVETLPVDPKARLDLLRLPLMRVCPNGIGEADERSLACRSGVPSPGLAIGRLLEEPEAMLHEPDAPGLASVGALRWSVLAEALGPEMPVDLVRLCQSYVGGWGASWLARPLEVQAPVPAASAEAEPSLAAPPARTWPRVLTLGERRVPVTLLETAGPTAVVRVDDPAIATWLCTDPLAVKEEVRPSPAHGVGALSVPLRWLSDPVAASAASV